MKMSYYSSVWKIRVFVGQALDWIVDRILGIRTYGITPLEEFSIHSENRERGVFYEATPIEVFILLNRVLPKNRDVYRFVDLGCGKGRSLLMAWVIGFRDIVGVEFAEELHAATLGNLQRLKWVVDLNRCIQVLKLDAVDYRFDNKPTVVFLYNPFDARVLQRVSEALLRDVKSELWVIYVEPRHASILLSALPGVEVITLANPFLITRPRGWISTINIIGPWQSSPKEAQ